MGYGWPVSRKGACWIALAKGGRTKVRRGMFRKKNIRVALELEMGK